MTNEQSLREALELCVPIIEGEREVIVSSYVNHSGPDKGKVTDPLALAILEPFDAALNAARQALSRPAMSEEAARELLAREYARENMHVQDSPDLGNGYFARRDKAAIAAIRAASERKEG